MLNIKAAQTKTKQKTTHTGGFFLGTPSGIRTLDTLIKSQVL